MKRIKGKKALLIYGCSGLGVNMLTLLMGTYLCSALIIGGFDPDDVGKWTFIDQNLVVAGLWAIIVFLAKALDGIIDLPFALLTDRIKSKFGRRKTGLVIGYIPMIISFILFCFPITNSESIANTIYLGIMLCIFYSFYTLTMLTYYATFSEVCETEGDTVFLSNVKSVCDVIYFILGFALVPLFVNSGINIKIVALCFLPLSLTMLIPMFMLKEKNYKDDSNELEVSDQPTIKESFKYSFMNKSFLYWMLTLSIVTIGLQLFTGGVNELFSSLQLNQTVIMAAAFAPVPFTIIVYNKIVKKYGLGIGYRYVLSLFGTGMIILFGLYLLRLNQDVVFGTLDPSKIDLILTIIAIIGGIIISFAIGAFFSVTYMVPTNLARREFEKTGKTVSAMYFAIQGIFEGIAAGIGTGLILVSLKDNNIIYLLPVVIIICTVIGFIMSSFFPKNIKEIGKTEGQA